MSDKDDDDNVVHLFGDKIPPIQEQKLLGPAKNVLEEALEDGFNDIIVLGWDKDNEYSFRTNISDGRELCYLLTRSVYKLNKLIDDLTE